MYAVIKTGGKQYRVAKNDVIKVERLTAEPGATIELDQVLMLNNGSATEVGAPLIDGARVAAEVLDQARNDKIIVFKKKRRQGYRRTKGHRQQITVLRITDILAAGQKASAAKAETKAPAKAAEPKAAEPKAAETKAPEAKSTAKKAATTKAPAKKAAPKKAPAKKTAAKKTAAKKTAAKKAASKKAPAKGAGTDKE